MKFPRNGRGGVRPIPASQMAVFTCACGSVNFETVSLTRMWFDRLDQASVKVDVRTAYRCLSCQGWVAKREDGSFHVPPSRVPGTDENLEERKE